MNRVLVARVLPALVLSLAAALPARSDFVMKMKVTHSPGKDAKVTHGTISVANPDRVAIEFEDPQTSGPAHVIFRGDREVLWVVDDEKKEYMEIDREAAEELGGTVKSALSQMEEQLAKLPPEQRKMVEEMMRDNPAMAGQVGAAAPAREARKTDETRTIHGFPCTRWDLYVGEAKEAELWVTPYGEVGLEKSDFAAFTSMAEFFQGLLEAVGDIPGAGELARQNPMDTISLIDGFPVLAHHLRGGEVESEMEYESVKKGEVPASVFEVP
jgi:hypothetical protein